MNRENKKKKLGQYFTSKDIWLRPHIKQFILDSGCSCAYDPFAGGGDLLNVSREIGLKKTVGLDIDKNLGWKINDSLLNIPHIDNAIIITNPPYIAKQSASRKKINLNKYFSLTTYDDVYLIALEKMLEAQDYVVAIVPESFINSSFKNKKRLNSITVLEANPFLDTENPVCVVCFDAQEKEENDILVYKDSNYVNNLKTINENRIEPINNVKITFNDKKGWLGLRAVDKTDDRTFINFDFKENIDYDWENKIKVSSRHITLISIAVEDSKKNTLIKRANSIINKIRKASSDILLTPFMGNTRSGVRRRRLDYRLARAILEQAYSEVIG